jgi:hypothetical protein
MKRPLSRAERAGVALSKVRHEMAIRGIRTFKLAELVKALKNQDCPIAQNVVTTLKELNAVIEVSYANYTFKSEEPIYIRDKFEELLEKRYKSFLKPSSSSNSSNISEEIAINYLKERGYKIFRVITTTEEL